MKTQTISGHRITLLEGITYRASRPFFHRGRTEYPVTIEPLFGAEGAEPIIISKLSYDRAAALVNEFNNGPSSFDGRIW